MAKSRLIGDYPVIGIRPTIDGRRGVLKVRESLEEQTMNMAKSAAKLFTENLRYSNGEPVKVVIATRPIVVSAITTLTGSPFEYFRFSSNNLAADFAMFIVCSSRDPRTSNAPLRPSIVGLIPITG